MLLIFAFLFRAVFKSGFIPATFFSHLAAVPKPIRNTHLPITNSAHINSWCAWGTCEKNTANPKRAANPPYLYPFPLLLGIPPRADRVFSWRQWASGAAAVWNAANCDAEQTALLARTSLDSVNIPRIPRVYSQTGCGIKSAVPKSMQARHASPSRWNGGVARLALTWLAVAHLCVIYCYFLSTFLSAATTTTTKSIQR